MLHETQASHETDNRQNCVKSTMFTATIAYALATHTSDGLEHAFKAGNKKQLDGK
jgi:hypothetical protein